MSRCLICNAEIRVSFSWINFVKENDSDGICDSCKKRLEPISGERCTYCSRDLSLVPIEYQYGSVCRDCKMWFDLGESHLDGNFSIFHYNEFMKDLIAQIKYRGDYKLLSVFSSYIVIPDVVTCVVTIPLSSERHLERGFNQVEGIAAFANIPVTQALKRVHSEKQAKKNRVSRVKSEQVFSLCDIELSGEVVLLLDDVYTTGTTLQNAAKVLKEDGGVDKVFSMTIAR